MLEHLGVEAYTVAPSRLVYLQAGGSAPGTHSAMKPSASGGVGGDTA